MKLFMRLLGWKRMSLKRRVKLQSWRKLAKKCVAIVGSGIAAVTVFVYGRGSVVVVSWAVLAGMAAWALYSLKNVEW